MLKNAVDSGGSVNTINRDAFKKFESLMSVILYPYDCETPLPILGKSVVEICSNCTDKRTLATFHFIDAATSCIFDKSTSGLSVLEPTRYEQISALTNSDFKYRLNSLTKIFLKARVL